MPTDSNWVRNKYPSVRHLRVVVERAEGVWEKNKSHKAYTEDNYRGEWVLCGNGECFGGGYFGLADSISGMIATGRTETEFTERCPGYNATPKGKIKRGKCNYRFLVKIEIEYNDTA